MKQILFFLLLLVGLEAYSQESDIVKDTAAINKKLDDEMEKADNNMSMAKALSNAVVLYDQLLNDYYKKCLSVIKAEDKKQFIETQRNWITWKENEFKLISLKNSPKYSGFSDLMTGTNLEEQLEIIKARVVNLYNYLAIFSSDFGK